MIVLKKSEDSGEISARDLYLNFGAATSVIEDVVTSALQQRLCGEDEFTARLDRAAGNISVMVPLGADFDHPCWKFDLRDLLPLMLESWLSDGDEGVATAQEWARYLRLAADDIDLAVAQDES